MASIVAAVAPLGEVRHRFERKGHARSLGPPCRSTTTGARPSTTTGTRASLYSRRRPARRLRRRARAARARRSRDLTPARTLDVACGTGFLTQHLPGEVVGLDQSDAMLEIAREQAPNATYVVGRRVRAAVPGRFLRARVHRSLLRPSRAARPRGGSSPRRGASPPRSSSRTRPRRPGHEPDEWQQRAISDGTTLAGLQARSSSRSSWSTSSAAARSSSRATGSSPSARDEALPLARLAPARQPPLPGLRRGRLPPRVAAGRRGPRRPARVPLRPGARRRRGRGGPPVARPRRPDAPRLARARRGRVLRDVLLRRGHALLPGQGAVRAAATGRRRRRSARSARSGASTSCASSAPRSSSRSAGSPRARSSASPSLTACVGTRCELDGAPAIPLPHPSGASGWLNAPGEPRAARARARRSSAPSSVALSRARLDFDGESSRSATARPSSACSAS